MSLSSSLCKSCRVFLYNSRRYCSSSSSSSSSNIADSNIGSSSIGSSCNIGDSAGGGVGGDSPATAATNARDDGEPSVSMTDDAVQTYLERLTGVDFDKVFKPHRGSMTLGKYQLLTEGELINVGGAYMN